MNTGGDRTPPSTPPAARKPWAGRLVVGLFVAIVLAYFLNVLLDDRQRSEQRRSQQATSTTSSQRPATPSSAAATPKHGASGPTVVQKCVQDGRTSYSDANCPAGAASAPVPIHPRQNLADGLPTPPSSATSAPGQADPTLHKLRCDALNARIKGIDVESRRVISPQYHEDMVAERKKVRDEQIRLGC